MKWLQLPGNSLMLIYNGFERLYEQNEVTPMVNARIRKAVRTGHAKVASVGPPTDVAYEHQYLGIGPEALIQIAEGRHPFCSTLASTKYPVLIVETDIFERKYKDAIMAAVDIIAKHAKVIRNEWNGSIFSY